MRYSFQLYSARKLEAIETFFPVLQRLGYAEVEGFGGLYGDPEGLAKKLADADLTMPTGHFGLDMLKDRDQTLKTAETLGIKTLICPAIPQDQRSQPEAGWKALADELAGLGEFYVKQGYRFAWHNHNFEFVPTAEGSLPMTLLLEGAPEIGWQCDVAWVARGAADPRAWLERYADRIVSVHVKDIAPQGENVDEDGWADVGQGVMGWESLLPFITERTGCSSFVCEHDNPSDVERFATRSIGFLQGLEASK